MIVGSNKTVRALGAIARSQEGRTLIEWLEQELADSDSRRDNLQGQIDGQLARAADIDAQLTAMEQELDALLHQAQELADSAKGAAAETETVENQGRRVTESGAQAR